MIIYNSKNEIFKKPFGCVKCGESVSFCVYSEDIDDVFLVLVKDGETPFSIFMKKEEAENGFYKFSAKHLFESAGLYFYHFESCGKEIFKNEWGKPSYSGEKWQITCYDEQYPINYEFCGKIMYQIFPDRFLKSGECDLKDKMTPFFLHENKEDIPCYKPDKNGEVLNNDFFGGNLKGIEKSLPYLADLGVEIIYLNPVFMAYSNHRYDTADYLRIDPMLGTGEDFKSLCTKAHDFGMKIILDGVFSHTGADSIYFDKYGRFGFGGAYGNADSKYKSWYNFKSFPYDYDSWWGIDTLPCVNELDESYCDFITGKDGVVRYWIKNGADGFRLDVADELPDAFIEKIKSASFEENKNSFVLGEVWEDASNKISYEQRRKYVLGRELDGVMNYVYKNAIIDYLKTGDGERFLQNITDISENYPPFFLLSSMVMLSTHDTNRILTQLASNKDGELSKEQKSEYRLSTDEIKEGKKKLYLAVFLLFTLPGNSCIYYGDEAGMEGFSDPFNRKYFGLEILDEEIFNLYKEMASLKKNEPCLRYGKIEKVFSKGNLVIFKRECDGKSVICAINAGEQEEEFVTRGYSLFCGKNILEQNEKITVLPWGYGIAKAV